MKQVHEISLETARAMDTFFDNNADIIEESALVKEDVLGFRTLYYALNDKITAENEVKIFTATDIQTFKTDIAKALRSGLDKVNAHALKTKDAVLKEACKTPFSTFTSAKDTEFVKMANTDLALLTTHKAVLSRYGLNEVFLTKLATDIANFDKMRPQLTVNRSKAVVSTGNRNEGFKVLDEYIAQVLDIAIETLTDSHSDFVKEYDSVSTGRTPSVSPTRLAITVLDDVTSLPILNAQINVPLIKAIGETDVNGKWVVRVGGKKELLLRITKQGMAPIEMTATKILRGKVLDVEVRMRVELLALAAG
jgi:hypothetical protein